MEHERAPCPKCGVNISKELSRYFSDDEEGFFDMRCPRCGMDIEVYTYTERHYQISDDEDDEYDTKEPTDAGE